MTTESLQKQIDEQKITDRAMGLFETQSPHQLAVTLAHFEAKHAEALSALDRMTDQRDQLAAQLKDATAQLARAEDLLRAAVLELLGLNYPSLVLVDNINGYLAGEVLPPAAPDAWVMASGHWKDEMVSILGPSGLIASGLTVKQASALIEAHGGVDTCGMAAPKPEGQ